ncbi:MAG: hypothetical protein M5U34_32565 [Chloroflexi bacterium]|nr:hypothetical protein [Chloroflexota bacterium]
MLKLGEEVYKNADEELLALLTGLEITPVQRNQGIDAFLRDDINGRSLPIRIQRADETILEAANKLYQAAKSKQAQIMFLVAIQEGGYFPFVDDLPPQVTLIEAPAITINNIIAKLKRTQKEVAGYN